MNESDVRGICGAAGCGHLILYRGRSISVEASRLFRSILNWFGEKTGVAPTVPPGGAPLLEPLEPRVLLSADFAAAAEIVSGPSDYEQYLVELINRARTDPAAEAARYSIDLNEGLAPGAISSDPKQPLAINLELLTAARVHSQWMIDNNSFGHTGVNDSSPGDRMTAAGYDFVPAWSWAENIAWYGRTPGSLPPISTTDTLHQDLFVDADIDGRGHRLNLMNPDFREIGPGIAFGTYLVYNAEMVTEDFAYTAMPAGNSFLTGVVYDDHRITRDYFYTPGEGFGGVTITATRASDGATFQTTTWSSGGYSLALPAGTYELTASGGGLSTDIAVHSIPMSQSNLKVDFTTDVPLLADLTLSKSHSGEFRQGDLGVTYSIIVSNVGAGSTTGAVTVRDTLPTGLTPSAANNGTINGWSVSTSGQTVTATRSDALAGGASYPALTITVDVAGDAPAQVTNIAGVSGGGEINTVNNGAGDSTGIILVPVITTSVTSISVPEGSVATFGVKLSRQPSGTVTVSVAFSSGDSDITVAGGSSLTFTMANWGTYQTVTLAAAADADLINGTATIRCSATGLADKDVAAAEQEEHPLSPVYRFWSDSLNGHFYTISAAERDKLINRYSNVWTYEGPVYYAFVRGREPAGTIPVYRFWSDTLGGHFYTTSAAERDKLISQYAATWIYEGPVFSVYARDQQPTGTLPVFRFWSSTYGHHFYTISSGERDKLLTRFSNVWTYELIAWYTYPYTT
jgi:uncharacterized repeat protein (TIGR01451 family)